MTARSSAPKSLTALFLLAVAGVLLSFGAIIGRAFGTAAVVVYVLAIAALVVVGVQWLRSRVRAASARAAGRSCTCCSGTVHDPVQVR